MDPELIRPALKKYGEILTEKIVCEMKSGI